ncbi:MAG: AraC family transcriptional regulator [Cyanobacteria bacterium P01_D01_bin.115]
MGLDLTWQESNELWVEAVQQSPTITSTDGLDTIQALPPRIGSGYGRITELQPEMELNIFSGTFHDLTLRMPENEHPLQFTVYLSGTVEGLNSPSMNKDLGLISGSGMQRPWSAFFSSAQPIVAVNVQVQPYVLAQLFGAPIQELPSELQALAPLKSDWQTLFSPKTTGAMRAVAHQLIYCPFKGISKRLYLQSKVYELMALQVEAITQPEAALQTAPLKQDTIARIYYAAEILRSRLEHPPSQTDLAQQVGLGTRTLQKGFKAVFGLTPFAYLTQQRMQLAEQLLRQPNCTVAEVSNIVGYANPARFAAAFKRHFGITPSECLQGKKIF